MYNKFQKPNEIVLKKITSGNNLKKKSVSSKFIDIKQMVQALKKKREVSYDK